MISALTNKYYSEWAIFKIINKYFWKTLSAPIFAFVFPLVFMIIYFAISADDPLKIQTIFAVALGSFFSWSILPMCLITLPQLLVELKSSIILRRIKNSNITALKYNLIISIYFLIMAIISSLYVFMMYSIFLNTQLQKAVENIDFAQLFYALLMLILVGISFGVMIGVLIRRASTIQFLGYGLVMISIMLAGQLMPLQVLGTVDAIRYITLFSPFNYPLALLNNVLVKSIVDDPILMNEINSGYNIFNLAPFLMKPFAEDINPVVIYSGWQKVLNLLAPYILTISFAIISVKEFRWSSR